MGFDGFISYSHAADGRLAPAVQRGLHSLAKPWHRRRALWIFRDQTGLAVTPALWSSIQNALNSSEYFVLMASPEAAQSPWVNKEIQHWVATKSPDRILPVLTDGEWRWDAATGDFSYDSTAVPAALRGVFAEEPLYLDLRWARQDGHLSLRHSRFRDSIAQLAAPMHGVSKDDLEGEDVRQHRRARRLWSVAAACLAVLTLVATLTGGLAVRNADRANASAAEALKQQQRASEQETNAGRSAEEADRQLKNARDQAVRAKEAVQETRLQEKRAQEQRALADRASGEAARQQSNARRQEANARTQQQAAEKAANRARQQETLARRQSELAETAGAQAREQKELAAQQAQLAREARQEAERQKAAAALQKKLAEQAAAEAKEQQAIAREQQKLAEQAAKDAAEARALAELQQRLAEEAAKDAAAQRTEAELQQKLAEEAAKDAAEQKSNAEQQRRIAIGRRVNNEAKAIAVEEPRAALQLSTAAAKVQADDEARRQLAGLVTSTHYAGELDGEIREAQYSTKDVVISQDLEYNLTLWNVSDRAKATIIGPLGNYTYWAVSPDGRTVAGAAYGKSFAVLIDVSEPATPQVLAEIPVASRVFDLTWNQDGSKLFVGAFDETKRDLGDLWNVSDPRRPKPLAARFDGPHFVQFAAFSPDGNTMVTVDDYDGTAVWNLTDPAEAKQVGTLDDPVGGERVNAMAFLRDTPVLIAGGNDHTLMIDLSDPADPRRTVTSANDGGIVTAVIVSRDGRRMVTGDQDGLVTVSDLVGTDPVIPREVMTVTDPERMQAAALSPDGATVLTADWNSDATMWNVTGYGAPVSRADLTGADLQGLATAYTANGSMLTVGGTGEVTAWSAAGSAAPVKGPTSRVHSGSIHLATLTPGGRFVAAADRNGRVRVSDLTDPAQPVTVAEFTDREAGLMRAEQLVLSPDGRTLGFGRDSGTVALWDVTKGRTPARLGPFSDIRMPLAFAPDGRTFAVRDAVGASASLWTMDGQAGPARLVQLGKFDRGYVDAIAFSPDGRTVAMGGSSAAGVWDLSTPARPRQAGRFINAGFVQSFVFSPDGRTIAAVDGALRATVWDFAERADPVRVADATLLTQRAGDPSRVRAAFSPDGRTLATGSTIVTGEDGNLTLWDLTQLAELRADPAKQACAMTGGGLTEDDWGRWIPELSFRPTC